MSRGARRRERAMVPEATFRSYYDRPVVKASPWAADIPAYLFLGGLAAGSSLLAAGADLTGCLGLRRTSRFSAAAALSVSFAALIHDLGRPSRFHHMLRVAKVSSPMSVGTWLLSAYAPLVGLAAVAEVGTSRFERVGRPAGLLAAAVAPAVASYTAVLLSDTATPTWHDAGRQLPWLFVGSAAAAAGGAAMVLAPAGESDVARHLAVAGAAGDLAATQYLEETMSLTGEPLAEGTAGRYLKAAKVLTGVGAAVGATLARRSRPASVVAGSALVAGSWCTRFGIFHAGQQSARDPRYSVVPQRQRLEDRQRASSVANNGTGG